MTFNNYLYQKLSGIEQDFKQRPQTEDIRYVNMTLNNDHKQNLSDIEHNFKQRPLPQVDKHDLNPFGMQVPFLEIFISWVYSLICISHDTLYIHYKC